MPGELSTALTGSEPVRWPRRELLHPLVTEIVQMFEQQKHVSAAKVCVFGKRGFVIRQSATPTGFNALTWKAIVMPEAFE